MPQTEPALERVLWRVRLRLRRRAEWLRAQGTAADASLTITANELDATLAGLDDPRAEAAWYSKQPELAELNDELAALEAELNADRGSRLAQLRDVFGLDVREVNTLHVCLAAALDPGLRSVMAALSGSIAGGPSAALLARLFENGWRATPPPGGALRRWELVLWQEGPGGGIATIDPGVFNWLLGRDDLDGALIGAARFLQPLEPLASWPVGPTVERVRDILESSAGARLRLLVAGARGSGRRTFAACVARDLTFRALALDVSEIDPALWTQTFVRAQRYAFLARVAPVWTGIGSDRKWPSSPDLFPLQVVCVESSHELPPLDGVIDHRVELGQPSSTERRALWGQYVPGSARWPQAERDALIAAHRVGPGEIANAASAVPRSAEAASRALREAARHQLGDLAQRLECPFRWADLVVDEPTRLVLRDIAYEARTRTSFWERAAARRLFPQGRGLIVLFNGPPGTGKTMGAQVIARRLRLDLFRIDLSTIVSKYVGETSQNLERVLRNASRTDAILFFDEADALFGKRTEIKDAHDRFANTDTGYLLQAIESYQGVAILATNRKANVDAAFLRRLRYIVDFAAPDASHRLEIWKRLVRELAGAKVLAARSTDLRVLADSVETSGAQIKSAVLGALFSARREHEPLSMKHLLRALERELGKEGRVLSERERRRLVEHARA